MRKYITDDIRLMKILDISAEKYIKILNGKIKRIKNKIFDYQDKINIRNDIIKDTKNDNIITLKEVKKSLKIMMKMKSESMKNWFRCLN